MQNKNKVRHQLGFSILIDIDTADLATRPYSLFSTHSFVYCRVRAREFILTV